MSRTKKRRNRRIPKLLAPANVHSMDEICALRRDNMDTRGGWIILNGPHEVAVVNQNPGEESTGTVHFSRRAFARLARWFLKPQRTLRAGSR
jgi:hypothetical protein